MRDNDLLRTLLRPDVAGDGPTWDFHPDDAAGLLSLGVGFAASRVELLPL